MTSDPIATHIILIRHGQSLYNREGASISDDSGLTELGWRQAHLVAGWLAQNFKADALVCSTLVRARQTAEVIGQRLGLSAAWLPGFEETRNSYWQELAQTQDDPLAYWDAPWYPDTHNAPLYTQFRAQIREGLARLLAAYDGKKVVVVAHGGSIGTIIRSLFGGHHMPIFTENCGVTHLVWQEGRWRLLSHNERAHLAEPMFSAALPWSEPGQLKAVVEYFSRVAASAPTPPEPASEMALQLLVATAAPKPADRVLDIGTGDGAVALAFAPHVAQVTAVDVSPAMLERAEQARLAHQVSNLEVRWADASALPYDAAVFDIVACRDLLHYINDLTALFQSLRRVLRADGKLVIDEIIGSEDPIRCATYQVIAEQRDGALAQLYNESEIERHTREVGFRIERADTYDVVTDLEKWLIDAALDESGRAAVRHMIETSIEEDAAGLRIQRTKDGTITFVQRRLRLLASLAPR